VTLDSRAEVIQIFRDRIQHGDHTRLSQDDFEVMIGGFLEALQRVKTQKKIQALCEAEIKLLEEGYPQASVAKYLSRYRKAIITAVDDGSLLMSRNTSHHYIHQQRVTGVKEERVEHWALTYLKYSQEVYNALDKRQQAVKLNKLSTEDISKVDEMPEMVEAVSVALKLPETRAKHGGKQKEEAINTQQKRAADSDIQTLPDVWRSELDRQLEGLRAEFAEQLQAAKQEHSVSWFVQRIEMLEEENLTLRLEQDHAISGTVSLGQSDAAEVDRLKAVNGAIALELKAVQQKLDAFRRLLDGDATEVGKGKAEDGAIALQPQAKQGSTRSREPQDAEDIPRRARTTTRTTTGGTRGPKAGKAFRRAETIVLAIKDWNRLHPDQSFAINAGVMENVFRVHRQAVKEFFEGYQNELSVYHQELGVDSPRWHNRGKDTQKLKAFVDEWVSKVAENSGEGAIS
jgi:Telomere resolvase